MGIEQVINQKLNKYPVIKKTLKRVYQLGMYHLSPKINSTGDIVRVSPDDGFEYFFGYYDKCPWDETDRYILSLKVKETYKEVAPRTVAKIVIIDTLTGIVSEIGETRTWNTQQGCMLQWFGNSSNKIIFNDFRNGKYCSIVLELEFKQSEIRTISEKLFPFPVYSVASDGSFALSLDFSRLHQLAPGYGYSNITEEKFVSLPVGTAIWKLDFASGDVSEVLSYDNIVSFEFRKEMKNAVHKVNHIMISPDNKRFMFLHRWFKGDRKYTRLLTCDVDGSDMYNLSDDDMVSHCFWRDNRSILAFENKKGFGTGYFLMQDKTSMFEQYWNEIDFDGHPSYSPNRDKIVFDSYPDKKRISSIRISDAYNKSSSNLEVIAQVFSPFRYDNEFRCDLHPRWNRKGNVICFDSVFEGKRGLYIVKVE
ncbi:hypothetical protein [Streptococcus suis]|uniref:Uncharacterized protein n=1 Tax=Streptococcus suis TaxID=1307 RepID=A0A3R8RA85_STRSU|nr:hypothetical protein [Streptococcus suis]RRR49737.1 hypothetical protein EJA00_02640 [Streptococcus suis]